MTGNPGTTKSPWLEFECFFHSNNCSNSMTIENFQITKQETKCYISVLNLIIFFWTLNVSQSYRPSRPVTGIALLFLLYSFILLQLQKLTAVT
jgi:hypothetical protein